MKKILLAFDGIHYSEGACEFAKKLNEKRPILLIGSFLPQADYANLWNYSSGGVDRPLFVPVVEDDNSEIVKKNIERFETFCVKNEIEFRVHNEYFDFALPELKTESRFADVLLLGGETFYENLGIEKPNDYLKEALRGVECPVLVVPEKFEFPESNILTYDGTAASVFAIKQFAYLFPEFADNRTVMIHINKKGEARLPEEVSIGELVSRHFNDLTMIHLKADPQKYFISWLMENKSAIVVSGAFSRSAFSEFFKKSFVTKAIEEHHFPLFIAHN